MNKPRRAPRRRVDGVLLLDKPKGLSSNAALQVAKRLYNADKAGHTGTLDPLATGLLPLCFGEATKFAQVLLDARKEYVATVRFGAATTTGDAEGEVTQTSPADFSRDDLLHVLPRFIGAIDQLPPRYAALKHEGRAYYDYARAGVEIPRSPRRVVIDAIELIDWQPPLATLRVRCGKGTYIRVLAEDIATALHGHAHLADLRRTGSGPFRIEGAVTLDTLESTAADARDALLLPPESALADLPRVDVDDAGAGALVHGRRLAGDWPADEGRPLRCHDRAGRFIGVVEVDGGSLRVRRLMSTARDEAAPDSAPPA